MRRAHGIRGELVVEPMVDEPLAVFASGRRVLVGPLVDSVVERGGSPAATAPGATGEVGVGAQEVEVTEVRPFKGGLLVRFAGLSDRTEAERWRERTLMVPSSELAEPAPGELFQHELEGMRVCDPAGVSVGIVSAWYEVPGGILLDVRDGEREATVPFNAHFVQNVDRKGRTLTIAIPSELWALR